MRLLLLTTLFVLPVIFIEANNTTRKKTTIMEQYKDDSLAIITPLNDYFKGIYEGDTALLGSTFQPGTAGSSSTK